MDADGAAVELFGIQDLMDRLFQFNLCCERFAKFEGIDLPKFAKALGRVDLIDRKILALQSPQWDSHPASLLGVVMNSRRLAFFPAYGHHFEAVVLIYKIAGVKFRAPMEIFLDRTELDRVFQEKRMDRVADE